MRLLWVLLMIVALVVFGKLLGNSLQRKKRKKGAH